MLAKNAFKKTKKPLSTAHRVCTRSCNRATRRWIFFPQYCRRLGRNVSTEPDCSERRSRDGTTSRRPDSKRPRDINENADYRIRCTAVVHRAVCAAEIRVAVGATVTQLTVRNWLLQRQLQDRHPVACIPLTPSHCRLRRQWFHTRAHWRRE
ncbi:transposable element Tc1 transposase [Trichonephila clavipes]|nr:transposable element Tc1 transposase [Trichonephila clavipes]